MESGDHTGTVTINNVTYDRYWQTDYTCTSNAFAFIAQAYTNKTFQDLVDESWIDGSGITWNAFTNAGIQGSYTIGPGTKDSMYLQTMDALSQGKLVFLYSNFKSSGGFHAVVLLGVDSAGKIVYYDPWGGGINTTGTSSDPAENIRTLIANNVIYDKHRIFIPNDPPPGMVLSGETVAYDQNSTSNGSSLSSQTGGGSSGGGSSVGEYIGFAGNEPVVAPITGVLLEYGTYTDSEEDKDYRANIDKEGAIDKVGYAKILVLNKEIAAQIADEATLKGYKVFTQKYEAVAELDLSTPEDDEDEKGVSNSSVAGFIVYIDGFVCETPSGTELSMDLFKSKAATKTGNTFTSSTYTETFYEPDPEYKLSHQGKQEKVDRERQEKIDAEVLYKFTGSINGENQEMLIIKEGTVIGRTMTNEELVNSDSRKDLENNPDEVQGNYLRIIMRDLDDTVVENVEEYMKLDEETEEGEGYSYSGTGGVARANPTSVSQDYEAQPGDLQLLANLLHHEGCASYFARRAFDGDMESGHTASKVTGYVLINRALANRSNKGTTIRDQILAPGQYSTKDEVTSGTDVNCEHCLANAEWCLTYDCSSITNPDGVPMPRTVYGQSGWCWCNPKYSCWWHVDTNKDGKYTEYVDKHHLYDTFFCTNC